MKKALIIFMILFLLTAIIPVIAVVRDKKRTEKEASAVNPLSIEYTILRQGSDPCLTSGGVVVYSLKG
ncbi:MAG: hypothetical protein IJ731_02295 [Eubacterium sp.]|nr:hypothetical protein [Eubacterium sp.]